MKKIGISCDAYKVQKFRTELVANGFPNFKVVAGRDLTAITVEVEDKDFEQSKSKIHALCVKIEAHFKRGN